MEKIEIKENINLIRDSLYPNSFPEITSDTPVSNKLVEKAIKLSKVSNYKTSFDFKAYQDLELRYKDKEFRGGFVFRTPFKLVNSHTTCQQCL
jgi:hypothetical protein